MTFGVDMVILAVGHWEEVQRTLILDEPVFPVHWSERAIPYGKASQFLFCRMGGLGFLPFICFESKFLCQMVMDSVPGDMFTKFLQFLAELVALLVSISGGRTNF